MPRIQREKSKSHIYHVMVRGIGKKNIFLDTDDRVFFCERLEGITQGNNIEVYGYCLMSNHFHLILNECNDELSRIMKSINSTYACYFNKKYERSGRVFQDRFRSEPIETEEYLLEAVRFIHRNPIRAGLVKDIGSCKWTSYQEYIDCFQSQESVYRICRVERMALLFLNNEASIQNSFVAYMSVDGDEAFIDYKNKEQNNAINAFESNHSDLVRYYKSNPHDKLKRNLLIQKMKEESDLSIRQIAQYMGISKDIVHRAK